jgi:hypothetical protein
MMLADIRSKATFFELLAKLNQMKYRQIAVNYKRVSFFFRTEE